jgi:hypothetical protein
LARLLLTLSHWRKFATDEGFNMMHRNRYLADELGEPTGMSSSAIALCCAIMEDAEVAREFEIEPRGAFELLRTVEPAYRHEQSPLPRELTSLIA